MFVKKLIIHPKHQQGEFNSEREMISILGKHISGIEISKVVQ